MKKVCVICGNKAGLQKLTLSDGYVCSKCMVTSGWGKYMFTSFAAFSWAKKHTVEDFKELTSNGGTFKDAHQEWVDEHKATNKPKLESESTSNPNAFQDQLAKQEAEKIDSWDIDERIKNQLIQAKVMDLFGVKKEVKYLSDIIGENETIKYACSGLVNGRTVLVVCTDSRIIFVNKNLVIGMQQEEIPLEYVNAVSFTQGVALGSISVTNGANTTLIENVGRVSAPIMAKTIREASKAIRKGEENTSSSSDLDNLKKLKELVDAGVITQAEFDKKRKEILKRI